MILEWLRNRKARKWADQHILWLLDPEINNRPIIVNEEDRKYAEWAVRKGLLKWDPFHCGVELPNIKK